MKSPHAVKDIKSPSPSYFGFVVGEDSIPGDSGPGPYVRQNWIDSSRTGAKSTNNDRNTEFELFRRQSEKNIAFALNGLPQTRTNSIDASSQPQTKQSPVSPTNTSFNYIKKSDDRKTPSVNSSDNPFFLGVQRQDSPITMSPRNSITDTKQVRLSLPAHEIQNSLDTIKTHRSDTLPPQPTKESHAMVGAQEVAKLMEKSPESAVILDLRVYPQYASSRVRGALNLCIPTTLLKRPAFTVPKLAETFTSDSDKNKFSKWKNAQYIIVYDATSAQAKEAITCFHVLKKFNIEGWKGQGLVIKGGFAAIQKFAPSLIDQGNKSADSHPGGPASPNSSTGQPKLPVAGGCEMPATKNAANPFFGNIRQNMDLLDGVGQMPIKRPVGTSESELKTLPAWLRRAASISNEGKDVSNRFLSIEKSEQKRMQNALSGSVSYGTPVREKTNEIQVAGIEKGAKNRYNNIFPFEHSRVRLQGVPSHGCDYVNASFVKADYSNRKYIATQAPIPQTFNDFWRVVWEQDARVIVMLTAESEGGQVKSHAYWKSDEYGSVKVNLTAEKKVSLLSKSSQSYESGQRKTSTGRRLTTSSATPAVEKKFNFDPVDIKANAKKPEEEPFVIVRYFTASIVGQSSQQAREITQIQYTQWPDFGAPASPTAILSLIDLVDKYQRSYANSSSHSSAREPAHGRQRPIVVHCSAGCGRTGTFCTVDSVIDMLKRQRRESQRSNDAMDVDTEDDWINRDDIDLVAKAVEDFRLQRLSMVQNLRQFVLCYESILQWLHDENTKRT